jgi:hypothetical protein
LKITTSPVVSEPEQGRKVVPPSRHSRAAGRDEMRIGISLGGLILLIIILVLIF